jgi:hypothetical protein
MPFCRKCGAQNDPEAVYCEECGSPIVSAGQPESAGSALPSVPADDTGAPASVEPPAAVPLADAGAPAPPEPPPAAGPPTPRRMPWRPLIALALVAALVAGIVGIYFVVSGNGGGDKEDGPLVGRETQEATPEPSPIVKETPTRKATPKPTVSPKSTPKHEPTATPTEEKEPPTASQGAQVKAIAAYVEESGEQYAGDCESTDPEKDIGKYCSMLWEDRGDSAIYVVGTTFSEIGMWVLLEQVDGDWVVSATALAGGDSTEPPW